MSMSWMSKATNRPKGKPDAMMPGIGLDALGAMMPEGGMGMLVTPKRGKKKPGGGGGGSKPAMSGHSH